MVVHGHLAKNPQTESDRQQWEAWAASASPAELFTAFLTRLSHSKVTMPDLDPVQRLLVEKLTSHLQPEVPDIAPVESEVA